MKKKDLEKLRVNKVEELINLLGEKEASLRKLVVNVGAGKEKNLKGAKNSRKEIAQIKTLVREKEIIEGHEKFEEKEGKDK